VPRLERLLRVAAARSRAEDYTGLRVRVLKTLRSALAARQRVHQFVSAPAVLRWDQLDIDPDRFGSVLAADWGWWRTVTRNLAKLPDLLSSQPGLAPPYPRFDALTQAKQLQEVAETVPKGLKWKTRARVGDRVRWYELPEEVDH